MSDGPIGAYDSANIGFTTFPQFFYSPVKNNAADAVKKVAAGMVRFIFKTRNFVSKTRNCVSKTINL